MGAVYAEAYKASISSFAIHKTHHFTVTIAGRMFSPITIIDRHKKRIPFYPMIKMVFVYLQMIIQKEKCTGNLLKDFSPPIINIILF